MGRKANLQKQSTKEKRCGGKYAVNKIILMKTETEELVVVHIVLNGWISLDSFHPHFFVWLLMIISTRIFK